MNLWRSETPTFQSNDEAAGRTLYDRLEDGWNRGSGAAFAAVFTDDADFVGFDGTHFKGRDEIASSHQQLFEKWLRGSRLVGQVTSVRFLSPDVAVMHALGRTVMRAESVPEEKVQSVAVQSMHLNRARSALTLIAWIAHGKHSRCRARP